MPIATVLSVSSSIPLHRDRAAAAFTCKSLLMTYYARLCASAESKWPAVRLIGISLTNKNPVFMMLVGLTK